MPRRGSGHSAERRALRHYRLRGFRVLAVNAWAGGNELDLVVRRGRRLAFVEVKEKRRDEVGDPLEMVGVEKQRRLRRAAVAWLGLNLSSVYYLAYCSPFIAVFAFAETWRET